MIMQFCLKQPKMMLLIPAATAGKRQKKDRNGLRRAVG
jgi:hypothetical protein